MGVMSLLVQPVMCSVVSCCQASIMCVGESGSDVLVAHLKLFSYPSSKKNVVSELCFIYCSQGFCFSHPCHYVVVFINREFID